MLSKTEIIKVISLFAEEPEVLQTIENIANSDDFHRNSFIDMLKIKFKGEGRSDLVISFVEQLRSSAFCPIVLTAISELNDSPTRYTSNSKIHGVYLVLLIGLVLVSSFLIYDKSEELKRVVYQNDQNNLNLKKLSSELRAFESEKAMDKISLNKKVNDFRRGLIGTWVNYNEALDLFPVEITFSENYTFVSKRVYKKSLSFLKEGGISLKKESFY